ncbi:MAG: hypothetical protein ABIA75_04430 [Candidatus Neomarinimicrobiota bacterium]
MIISRFIPLESARYKKAQSWSRGLDRFFLFRWEIFFVLWTMLLAGFSAALMQEVRHLYWETALSGRTVLMFFGFTLLLAGFFGFCGLKAAPIETDRRKTGRIVWILALVGLLLLLFSEPLVLLPLALVLVLLGPATGYRPFNLEDRSPLRAGSYLLAAYFLFFSGWIYKGGDFISGLIAGLPYVLGFLAVLLIYWIPLTIGNSPKNLRMSLLLAGLALDLAAAAVGLLNNDPVISTAAAIYAPFLLIAIVFPPHIRHLQRARIYPIFILALLVAVRHPWFLLPLILNFWLLRSYSYLRYGHPQPTFGVDFD